jgi:alpha-N-arabinofuranosidase
MKAALQMEPIIAAHTAIMDKYDPEKKVGLDVDEWGNWYDPTSGSNPGFLEQQNTLRDAVTAALNLNIFHSHADRVRMACIAQMVNVLQALVLTDGAKMLLTPTYHVFMMYKPFRGATDLPVEISTPDYTLGDISLSAVHASAARTPSGALVIALVNIDPHHTFQVQANIAGAAVHAPIGTILTADAMDSHNTFEHPDSLTPAPFRRAVLANAMLTVPLPAKSIVVLTLQ